MNKNWMLLAVLGVPVLGLSQTLPQQAAAAATADAPVPAIVYQPLEPAGASALVQEGQDWKAANAAVGQYARGHRDILKWEKAQPPTPVPATPSQEAPR